jgi:hypothetical protein
VYVRSCVGMLVLNQTLFENRASISLHLLAHPPAPLITPRPPSRPPPPPFWQEHSTRVLNGQYPGADSTRPAIMEAALLELHQAHAIFSRLYGLAKDNRIAMSHQRLEKHVNYLSDMQQMAKVGGRTGGRAVHHVHVVVAEEQGALKAWPDARPHQCAPAVALALRRGSWRL